MSTRSSRATACAIVALLAGCATPPVYITRTVQVPVNVPGPMQPVPPELSKDCAPAALTGSHVGEVLERLQAVEDALADCRARMGQIRFLSLGSSQAAPQKASPDPPQ